MPSTTSETECRRLRRRAHSNTRSVRRIRQERQPPDLFGQISRERGETRSRVRPFGAGDGEGAQGWRLDPLPVDVRAAGRSRQGRRRGGGSPPSPSPPSQPSLGGQRDASQTCPYFVSGAPAELHRGRPTAAPGGSGRPLWISAYKKRLIYSEAHRLH